MSLALAQDMILLMDELVKAEKEVAVYQEACAGLNPTAYRECVEALKLIISIIPDGNSPSHLKAKQAVAHAEGKE